MSLISVCLCHRQNGFEFTGAKLHNFPEPNKKLAEKVAGMKNNAYICSVKP